MSFSPEIYAGIREGCQRSAELVVPRIVELFEPKRVADVGGGEGWWGKEFAVRGIPADVYDETLHEDQAGLTFYRLDFERRIVDPAPGTYDLALCLEVAEHLTPESGDRLVRFLTQLAPVVVFSAAIPHQGGHGHLNEQWPVYWSARFAICGMVCVDRLRWEFWDDPRVEPWYRQNLLVFANPFKVDVDEIVETPPAVVHPEIYRWRVTERDELRGER